jgi:transposase InsO family protein
MVVCEPRILDLFSRTLVGWAMGLHADEKLVQAALSMAVGHRRPSCGLIHHSDQGSQYSSSAYQQRLKELGIVSSMSRRGNCYDNAPMESFWATLKKECIYRSALMRREQARQAIFLYREGFYQHHRRHSALGYLTPAQFEAQMT